MDDGGQAERSRNASHRFDPIGGAHLRCPLPIMDRASFLTACRDGAYAPCQCRLNSHLKGAHTQLLTASGSS